MLFDEFEVYVNEEGTRTFVGMRVHPSAHLFKLIKVCDKLLAEYDLEPYYEVCLIKWSIFLIFRLEERIKLN
jgi:hypothetical protein